MPQTQARYDEIAEWYEQWVGDGAPLIAAQAGLLPGDVVIRLDGLDVNGVDDLIRVLDRDRIEKTLAMDVLRLGRLRAIEIHPVERKPAPRQ